MTRRGAVSDPETERRRALVFFVGLSACLVLIAVASLTFSPAAAAPGVTVSALVLLGGAAYGLVASIVLLARRRGTDTGESATPASDRAEK